MYAENNDFLDRPALDAYIYLIKIRHVIPLQRDFDALINLLKSRRAIPHSSGKPDLRL